MAQYIDKDKIVAEIERLIEIANNNYAKFLGNRSAWAQQRGVCEKLLSFIDILEVKEVDLEKELETLNSLLYDLDGVAVKGTTSYLTVEDIKDIAKHFFELGLKAQKGE